MEEVTTSEINNSEREVERGISLRKADKEWTDIYHPNSVAWPAIEQAAIRHGFDAGCNFGISSRESEVERLIGLVETLKSEARIHAQEARTANSTIYEINQIVSGATGEKGNWNGVEPVRQKIAELTAALSHGSQEEKSDDR